MPPCRYIPELVIGGCTFTPPETTTTASIVRTLPRTGGSTDLADVAVALVIVGALLLRAVRR